MKTKQLTINTKPKASQIKNLKIKKVKNSGSSNQVPKSASSNPNCSLQHQNKKFINYEYYLTQLPVQLPPFLKKIVKNFKSSNFYLDKSSNQKNIKIFQFLNDISVPNKKTFDLKMKEMKEFCSRQANEIQAIFADSSIFDKNKLITINPSTNQQFESFANLRKSVVMSSLADFSSEKSCNMMSDMSDLSSISAQRVISVNATKNDLKIKLLFKPTQDNSSSFSRTDSQQTIIPDQDQVTPTKSQIDFQDQVQDYNNLIQPMLGIQDCQQQLKEPFLEKKLSTDDSTDILSQYSQNNDQNSPFTKAQNAAQLDANLHDMNQFFQENYQQQKNQMLDGFDLMNFDNMNDVMDKEGPLLQMYPHPQQSENNFAYDDYLDFYSNNRKQEQNIQQIIINEDDCFWQKNPQNQYKGMMMNHQQTNFYSFEQACDI